MSSAVTRTVASAWTCALLILICASDFQRLSSAQELEGFEEDADDSSESEFVQVGAGTQRSGGKAKGSISSESDWDEDEFEGFTEEKLGGDDLLKEATPQRPKQIKRSVFKRQEHYHYEMLAGVVLVLYGINVFIGRQKNEALALAWARAFVSEGGVLERNFSLLGAGDGDEGEVLMKESQSVFKFYASGRRFCQGLMATLDLRARQDLLSMLTYMVLPREDTLEVEVYMNPTSMPAMVLACATHKLGRSLLKDNEDLKTFCKQIPVKQIADWPKDRLVVHTESSEVFYDVFSPEIRAVFSEKEFEATTKKYFRYLHLSSEYTGSTHRNILRFSFALPPPERMEEDLVKLVSLIPSFIDVIGTYKLSPEAKKRAEKMRAEQAEKLWKEGAESRREALQNKKREEYEADLERIKKLPPGEQAKWMERQAKLKQRKSVKVKMVRA
ncbi:hypothetical protein BSKO_11191 [Bryopsis sp. KO-2023]|nr:hypothetical protein BSKO_11191 [Bryopsis sp. KO-2023]